MSVSRGLASLFICLLIGAGFWSCQKDDDFNEGPFQSKRTEILSFDFKELPLPVEGTIDKEELLVTATVPFGTDRSALVPTITISEKASISPPSGTPNDFTEPATYIVTAENGTTQEWLVVVEESAEEKQPMLSLSNPIWNLSPSGTSLPPFFTQDGERGLDYGNGHLYITSNNDKILVLSPADGSQIGQLDMSGVEGGGPKIADVEVSEDGSILACNTVEWTSAEGGDETTFKIYRWENESSKPELFLSYTNTQYRMGDTFSVIGDVSGDAVILTSFGRKFLEPTDRGNIVFKWTVTGGVVNPEPELIQIQGVPTLTKLGSRPHAQMLTPESDKLYVNGNDIDFIRTTLDGAFEARLPNNGRQLYDGFTSHFEIFEFAGKRVLAAVFPRSNVESRLLVIDITKGLENVTTDEVILSQNFMQGGGEISNDNAGGAVAINKVDNNRVEIYTLITNQALVKFNLTTVL